MQSGVTAAEIPVYLLDSQRISEDSLASESVVYFGTPAAEVQEEEAEYVLPIFRDGDCSEEASIEIRTVDLTAVYGKDYAITENSTTKFLGDGRSIMQKYADGDYAEEADGSEGTESVTNEIDSSLDPDAMTDKEKDAVFFAELYGSSAVENTEEKSELAKLKEEQTGQPTRDPVSSDDETDPSSLADSLLMEMGANLGNYIDNSSVTQVVFAPDETQKDVHIRIFHDEEAEGAEGFSLILSNPVGTETYGTTASAFTIIDDEPVEHSVITFSDEVFYSEDGKAIVKVTREGAEYSMADAILMTSSDTAVSGENFIAQNATVAFQPYEMEKEIEFDVSGEGSFNVLLDDLHACEAGEIMKASINIQNEQKVQLLAADAAKTFQISINDKSYDVEYEKDEITAKIFDKSFDPPLEVGKYYFPVDYEHGGNFAYHYTGGDKPGGTRQHHYEYHEESFAPPDSYGKLYYYHSTAWKKGWVASEGALNVPGIYYQYFTPDWASVDAWGTNQKARFEIKDYADVTYGGTSGSAGNRAADVMNHFSRTQNKAQTRIFGETNQNLKFRFSSIDDSSQYTPKTYLRVYGVAAMYKQFRISVSEPNNMTFKTGSGTISALPTQIKVQCGAQIVGANTQRDIFANPDEKQSNLVFSYADAIVNGEKGAFGDLEGYTLTISGNDTSKKKTVNYPEDFISFLKSKSPDSKSLADYGAKAVESEIKKINDSLLTVPYDAYFLDWIESIHKDKYDNNAYSYYQSLNFKPRTKEHNVDIDVWAPAAGIIDARFNDNNLVIGKTYSGYKAGDVIDLRGTVNNHGSDEEYIFDGYEVSTNGGVTFDTIRSTNGQLFLEKNKKYIIRPSVVQDDNKIEIKFANEKAKESLHLLSVVEGKDIANVYEGKYFLNVNPEAATAKEKVKPVVGEIYQIQAIAKKTPSNAKYVYRPTFTVESTGREPYITNCLDFVAKGKTSDNVITVDSRQDLKSDLKYYRISGVAYSEIPPIRDSIAKTSSIPVRDYNLYISGEEVEIYDSKIKKIGKMVNRVNATTNDAGEYQLDSFVG